jgi:hypothetical protein
MLLLLLLLLLLHLLCSTRRWSCWLLIAGRKHCQTGAEKRCASAAAAFHTSALHCFALPLSLGLLSQLWRIRRL